MGFVQCVEQLPFRLSHCFSFISLFCSNNVNRLFLSYFFFITKGNQTMLHIFTIMVPAVQMEIWPCSASLRIHPLVRLP